jgi:hypothetical protein
MKAAEIEKMKAGIFQNILTLKKPEDRNRNSKG